MKMSFIAPPGGEGIAGDKPLPMFGSPDCFSRSKIKTAQVECQQDENGRYYAVNPFTGKRLYSDEVKKDAFGFKALP